jgi:hypothetical protein
MRIKLQAIRGCVYAGLYASTIGDVTLTSVVMEVAILKVRMYISSFRELEGVGIEIDMLPCLVILLVDTFLVGAGSASVALVFHGPTICSTT